MKIADYIKAFSPLWSLFFVSFFLLGYFRGSGNAAAGLSPRIFLSLLFGLSAVLLIIQLHYCELGHKLSSYSPVVRFCIPLRNIVALTLALLVISIVLAATVKLPFVIGVIVVLTPFLFFIFSPVSLRRRGLWYNLAFLLAAFLLFSLGWILSGGSFPSMLLHSIPYLLFAFFFSVIIWHLEEKPPETIFSRFSHRELILLLILGLALIGIVSCLLHEQVIFLLSIFLFPFLLWSVFAPRREILLLNVMLFLMPVFTAFYFIDYIWYVFLLVVSCVFRLVYILLLSKRG